MKRKKNFSPLEPCRAPIGVKICQLIYSFTVNSKTLKVVAPPANPGPGNHLAQLILASSSTGKHQLKRERLMEINCHLPLSGPVQSRLREVPDLGRCGGWRMRFFFHEFDFFLALPSTVFLQHRQGG